MGTEYRIWLYDEWDWGYANLSKTTAVDQMLAECPAAELAADFHQWLVFDVGRRYPTTFLGKRITCDEMFFTSDDALYPYPVKVSDHPAAYSS